MGLDVAAKDLEIAQGSPACMVVATPGDVSRMASGRDGTMEALLAVTAAG
jgi:hypothetical protein